MRKSLGLDRSLPVQFGVYIKDLARGDNYHTMAGFVLWHLGRLPKQGEKMAWRDLSIEVVDMDGLVIDKLLITRRVAQALRTGQSEPVQLDELQD